MTAGTHAALRGTLLALTSALLALLGAVPLAANAQAGPAAAGPAASASPISAAEQLMFQADHLSRLKAPASLRYHFTEQGGKDGDVQDEVTLQLRPGSDKRCCTVAGSYLSGARALSLPEVPDARSNPVLLYFLEHQVRQMQQVTGGQSAHFRRRIRNALADAATLEPATMTWNGQQVAVQRVSISPYLDDPQRHRFEKQARTHYSFVFSNAVPGGVLQLSALLADGERDTRQTLTLHDSAGR